MFAVTTESIETLDAIQLAGEISQLDHVLARMAQGESIDDLGSLLSLRKVAVGRLDYLQQGD